MIQIKTVVLTDEDVVSLSLDYNDDCNNILIKIEEGCEFSVPVAEWDEFIQKIQSIKELITPQTIKTDESKD